MRVISGIFRSRKLMEVNSDSTRETKDRVKESIFNSIQQDLIESHVLDLFAGSGSLGIEAISRGASSCVFVDKERVAINALKQNILNLDIASISEIHHLDYISYLESRYQAFDLILLDPPYHMEVLEEIIELISNKKLLKKNGIIVCLYSKKNEIKTEINDIIEYKKKTIGITKVSFMKWGI